MDAQTVSEVISILENYTEELSVSYVQIVEARGRWKNTGPQPLTLDRNMLNVTDDEWTFRLALLEETRATYIPLLNAILAHLEICRRFAEEIGYVSKDVPYLFASALKVTSQLMDNTKPLSLSITVTILPVEVMDTLISLLNFAEILGEQLEMVRKYVLIFPTQ